MNETSRLEKRTRELADEYMKENPGISRQEAKRRVRHRAGVLVAIEDFSRCAADFLRVWNAARGRPANKNRS